MLELIIVMLLLTLVVEGIYRLDPLSLWKWVMKRPFNVWMNVLAYMVVTVLLDFILPTTLAVSLTCILGLILAYANKYKVKFRGDEFFPWDLKLGKESSDMSDYIKDKSVVIDLIIAVIIVLLGRQMANTVHLNEGSRLFLLLLGLVMVGGSYGIHVYRGPVTVPNQHIFHRERGVLIAFLLNLKELFYPYSSKRNDHMREDLSLKEDKDKSNTYASEKTDQANHLKDPRPNVIVIMNESFWDPQRLPKAHFSRPITPTLDALRKESLYGDLVSPEFGGGTSNIEFELLTGANMHFLPVGSMAFQSYLKKPVEALPHLFKNMGYQTLGLHSYERWFWKREQAYDYMGFDQFITKESFDNPHIKGLYISDQCFSEKVIETYEQAQGPLFLYGITMQNHGPHQLSRYAVYDVNVKAPLNDKALGELKCYTQGALDADRALKTLIDYFSGVKKHTYIVFFGDHLPMLGGGFKTYKDCGMIGSREPVNWSYEEQVKMASTPFVIWSNRLVKSENLGPVSPAFLGTQIMELAGVKPSSYFESIESIYSSYPMINHRVTPNFETYEAREAYVKTLATYRKLQEDQLF